jgi:hypothetical protein
MRDEAQARHVTSLYFPSSSALEIERPEEALLQGKTSVRFSFEASVWYEILPFRLLIEQASLVFSECIRTLTASCENYLVLIGGE